MPTHQIRSPNHHAINSGEQDIFEQDLMEETPNFRPTCISDSPYLVVEGNIHQAMWILIREQVDTLQGKCSFLNQSSPSRYMTCILSDLYRTTQTIWIHFF
jgi:hypothetical protein